MRPPIEVFGQKLHEYCSDRDLKSEEIVDKIIEHFNFKIPYGTKPGLVDIIRRYKLIGSGLEKVSQSFLDKVCFVEENLPNDFFLGYGKE